MISVDKPNVTATGRQHGSKGLDGVPGPSPPAIRLAVGGGMASLRRGGRVPGGTYSHRTEPVRGGYEPERTPGRQSPLPTAATLAWCRERHPVRDGDTATGLSSPPSRLRPGWKRGHQGPCQPAAYTMRRCVDDTSMPRRSGWSPETVYAYDQRPILTTKAPATTRRIGRWRRNASYK